ncbi:MAG: hypothetical protein VKK32_01170 [Candidatus Melainabacteria bacterium]|jgi:hypothetical protein|nr:hypothetical protein [Candidatus Melainabacteria bacterium]
MKKILKNILIFFVITLISEVQANNFEKIRLNDEYIQEFKDYQIGYRSNLAPLETHNESSTIKIPVAKIKPKIGVLNTELIYQPWDKTYQIGGSLDLMEITKKYKQEQRLSKECDFDLSRCPEFTTPSIEENAKTVVIDVFSRVKETTREVYRVTKDQFSVCNENNICY